MTTQETVKVNADLIFTTDHGEVPTKPDLERLISDQMSGELDEATGLGCMAVTVTGVSGDLDETNVYVLSIDHKHGTNTYIHRTEEGRRAALLDYVAEEWDREMIGRRAIQGNDLREMESYAIESARCHEQDLIELYFEAGPPDECFRYEQATVRE